MNNNRFSAFYTDVLVQFKNIFVDLITSTFHFKGENFKRAEVSELIYDDLADVGLKNAIFGGNQLWFPTKVGRDSGCGVTSASDITAYLAKYYDGYSSLYTYDKENMNKDDFLKHMEDMYKYMPPTRIPFRDMPLIGVPFAETYKRGVISFAKSRGVNLKVKIFKKRNNLFNIVQFIKEGLSQDRPVAMIQWENKKLPHYKFHWMTIIKYEVDEKDDIYIYCLTWGQVVKLDLNDVLNPKGILKRFSFLYIE